MALEETLRAILPPGAMRGAMDDDAAVRIASEISALSSDPSMSLQNLCPDSYVVGALLDLIMYQDSALTEAAVGLLHTVHCGAESLVVALHGIQLIVSPTTVRYVLPRARA